MLDNLFCSAILRKLDEQPDWLKGGVLRDYQLEGLNFLVNRYAKFSLFHVTNLLLYQLVNYVLVW